MLKKSLIRASLAVVLVAVPGARAQVCSFIPGSCVSVSGCAGLSATGCPGSGVIGCTNVTPTIPGCSLFPATAGNLCFALTGTGIGCANPVLLAIGSCALPSAVGGSGVLACPSPPITCPGGVACGGIGVSPTGAAFFLASTATPYLLTAAIPPAFAGFQLCVQAYCITPGINFGALTPVTIITIG